jgi:hypothetical protein
MIMEITMKYEKEKEKNSHRVQGLAILFWVRSYFQVLTSCRR